MANPPTTEPDPTPEPEAPEPEPFVRIDMMAWTGSMVLGLEQEFDTDLSELESYVLARFWSVRSVKFPPEVKIKDGTGRSRFAQEVLRFMALVELQRTRPDAKLPELDHLTIGELKRCFDWKQRAEGKARLAAASGSSTST
ncbi:MAG: hypothetical protein ACRCW4_13395 [Candidatus Neomicrothrix subdominans]